MLLRILFIGILFSCATSSLKANESSTNILMVLWRGETEAEAGFRDGLKAAGVSSHITVVDAKQNRETLSDSLRSHANQIQDFDFLYSFGTTASKMVKQINRNRIPHIFNMVTDPVAAGLVESIHQTGTDKTGAVKSSISLGKKIAGISDAIPEALRLKVALALFPIARMAVILNPREQNSVIQLEQLRKVCQTHGIKLTLLRVAPGTRRIHEVAAQLQFGEIDVDTLYIPSDSYLISQQSVIMNALTKTSYKVIGPTKAFVEAGALIGVAPDYHMLGIKAAKLIHRIRQGEDIENISVVTVEQPGVFINSKTRERLNISMPNPSSDLLKNAIELQP